jgi:uncharacterized protein (TIGR02117 family)
LRTLSVLLLASWLAGCGVMPIDPPVPDGTATIYVVHRGWHTDIGLPVEPVSGPLAALETTFPGVRYMVFGFGERHYYMAQAPASGEMLSALLPSKSAILLTALRATPAEAFADHDVVALRVSPSGVEHLATLVWLELEKAPDGSARRLADGPYAGSVFYASSATYDAFHTCNTWTAQLLRDGGLPMSSQGVLFASQVMQQANRIAALQARGS